MTQLGSIKSQDEMRALNHAHPVGVVVPFAAEMAVDTNGQPFPGWLFCRGQAVSSASFPALDAVIGAAAPTGAVHACNGGIAPASGQFRVPNLQRAIPLHKTASGTGSNLGNAAGGIPYGDSWTHSHGRGGLYLPGHTHYSLGDLTMPSHTHTHDLYEGDHTHTINGATSGLWGNGNNYTTNIYYDQGTTGYYYPNGGSGFSQDFPSDGGRQVDNYRLGSVGDQALPGSATSPATAGPAGPYLMLNYLIKV